MNLIKTFKKQDKLTKKFIYERLFEIIHTHSSIEDYIDFQNQVQAFLKISPPIFGNVH